MTAFERLTLARDKGKPHIFLSPQGWKRIPAYVPADLPAWEFCRDRRKKPRP